MSRIPPDGSGTGAAQAEHAPAQAELLTRPVTELPGARPFAAQLDRLGLETVADVLFGFPRDYQDFSEVVPLSQLSEGLEATVTGEIRDVDMRNTSTGRVMLGVLIEDGAGHLRAVWFNQAFRAEQFRVGQQVVLRGRVRLQGLVWEMVHPQVQWPSADGDVDGSMRPVYPLCEGVSQALRSRLARHALKAGLAGVEEMFPPAYLTQHGLLSMADAVQQIHFPENKAQLEQARRRLAYQELFLLQMALAMKRQHHQQRPAPVCETSPQIDARIRRRFPFELTPGQESAVREIAVDLARPFPMNRLLVGDVGSGKTVVALYAMLVAVAHGNQVAMMAPTETLARQHAQTLAKMLDGSQVRQELLTGSLRGQTREEVLARVAAGEVDMVIGTQALLTESVEFARLGLVVIDEGHKFGVRQRAVLRGAALAPHYLVLSATPLPRTLTMTLFGDLDITELRERPAHTHPVKTYLADEGQREQWWEFVRKKLREGRQGFIIAPRLNPIAGDEETSSVEEMFEWLANGPFEAFRLGLAHGRLTPAQKEDQFTAFARGEIQLLVASTIVEVGIDVPNATLMTIESGQNFGLTQLHQLRGRVARGSHPGFCTVFADPKNEEAQKRLAAFVSSADGFELAQLDLELRGPGNLLGTRQHGLPPLHIADLVRDANLLAETRRDAWAMLAADPDLQKPEHAGLKRKTLKLYGKVLELGNVG